jgi:hypothetical protein
MDIPKFESMLGTLKLAGKNKTRGAMKKRVPSQRNSGSTSWIFNPKFLKSKRSRQCRGVGSSIEKKRMVIRSVRWMMT